MTKKIINNINISGENTITNSNLGIQINESTGDKFLLEIEKMKEEILKSEKVEDSLKNKVVELMEKVEENKITKEKVQTEINSIAKEYGVKALNLLNIIGSYASIAGYFGL